MSSRDLIFERKWAAWRLKIKKELGRLPDLNAVLMLIGIQELGQLKKQFSKEEKQDLMHIGVCTLLSPLGYYRYIGRDAGGWPHFELLKPLPEMSVKEQELLLKKQALKYLEKSEEPDEIVKSN